MHFDLTDDQQLFRETTASSWRTPVRWTPVRRHRRGASPGASTATGGGGGPSSAGCRCWCPRTTAGAPSPAGPGRPGAGGRGDGAGSSHRDRSSPPTWWPGPCPGRGRPPNTSSLAGLVGGDDGGHLVPGRGVHWGRRSAPRAGVRGRAHGATVSSSRAPPAGGGRRPRPICSGDGPVGPGAGAVPGPLGGRRGVADAGPQPRPGPAVRPPPLRPGRGWPPTPCWGSRRIGGGRHRAPARGRRRPPVRRDGRGRRPGPRVHPRVRPGPVLVRPAAGLVPGPQAPLRRHEAVARGVTRHVPMPRPGRWTRDRPTPPSWSAWPSPTSATRPRSSCPSACSSTGASGSPGTTISISTSRRVVQDRAQFGTPARPPGAGGRGGRDLRRNRGRDNNDTTAEEDVEAFRLRAREWLADDHAPPARGGRQPAAAPGRRDRGSEARRLQRLLFDGGFAGLCFPAEYGGLGSDPRPPAGLHPGVAALPDAHPVQRARPCRSWPRPCSTSAPRSRRSVTSAGHPAGRRALGPVPLRAERGVGPGRAGDPGHPGRGRVRAQRFEDLELGGVPLRLRHVPGPDRLPRAQAPGPDHVHREDPPARHRGPADQHGQRAWPSSARSSSTTWPSRPRT